MAKYDPLEDYLKNLAPTTKEITLSFDQINQMLESDLPYSAHIYREWWANEANGSHVEAHAWMNAGWKVGSVDFDQKRVRFLRKE